MLEFIGLVTVVAAIIGAVLLVVFTIMDYFEWREKISTRVEGLAEEIRELEE